MCSLHVLHVSVLVFSSYSSSLPHKLMIETENGPVGVSDLLTLAWIHPDNLSRVLSNAAFLSSPFGLTVLCSSFNICCTFNPPCSIDIVPPHPSRSLFGLWEQVVPVVFWLPLTQHGW